MDRRYQVFVSSTYEDLKEERQAVISSLLDINCIPVGMEQFPASSLSQWDYIKRMIDMSDYYILIVAGKYGSINQDVGISYTQQEYEYAAKKKVPILAFLYKDLSLLPGSKLGANDDERERVLKFHEEIKSSGRLVNFYVNIDELKSKVMHAISRIIHDEPRPGWIRAGTENKNIEIPEIKPISKEFIDSLFAENNNNIIHLLSENAKELLKEVSRDSNGEIFVYHSLEGLNIHTNGKKINKENFGRNAIVWEDCIEELINANLVKSIDGGNELYRLTKKGYEISDLI